MECDPAAADTFFHGAVHEPGVPASFKDDTLVALLRARSAPALIEKHRAELLSAEKQLLKRVIRLVRVACVTTPAWLPGGAALFNVPDGPAWAALLSVVQSGWQDFGVEDSLLLLGLLEDWAKSVSPHTPYPQGAVPAAAIAHSLVSRFDDYSHEEELKRTLQIIAKIPNAERVRFIELLSHVASSRRDRDRVAGQLQNLVFTGWELKRRRQEIPVVFITAHGNATIRPRLLEQGAVECLFLFKPFSDTALLEALNAALGVSRTSSEQRDPPCSCTLGDLP